MKRQFFLKLYHIIKLESFEKERRIIKVNLKREKSPKIENKELFSAAEVTPSTYIVIHKTESQDFLDRGSITELTVLDNILLRLLFTNIYVTVVMC